MVFLCNKWSQFYKNDLPVSLYTGFFVLIKEQLSLTLIIIINYYVVKSMVMIIIFNYNYTL